MSVTRLKEAEYGSEIPLVFPLLQYVWWQCCLWVVLATVSTSPSLFCSSLGFPDFNAEHEIYISVNYY